MVPDISPESAALRQAQLIALIETLTAKTEESRIELRLLRTELGMDSMYGRLPIVEQNIARHEARMTKLEELIEKLEENSIANTARQRLMSNFIAACSGGAGGALIALVGKLMFH